MSAYDTFINTYPVGSRLDTDNFPAGAIYQCFDAAVVYLRVVANNSSLYVRCASSGYVKDWWNDFASNGLNKWFDQVAWNSQGQPGDIVIWGNAPATPLSHIAILVEDKGTVQRVYGQNQPEQHTTIKDLPSRGILGYLRPKNQGGSNMGQQLIDESHLAYMRINNSEIKGWDRAKTHAGEFDASELNGWRGQPLSAHTYQAWNEGSWYRDLKDAWKAAFEMKPGYEGKIINLSDQIVEVQTELASTRAVAHDAQTKLTIAESTIEAQNKTIEELKKTAVEPETGDGGTAEHPPVSVSAFTVFAERIRQFIINLTKDGKR